MNLDIFQHLISKVKFANTPEFTKSFNTKRGAVVDTFRYESPFGSDSNGITIRSQAGGCDVTIMLSTAEASALMCCLLAQLNKLEEYDAKRNAVVTEDDAN